MKAMLRKSSLLVLVFAMALGMLAGCGMKPEDAKAYVQATLDAGYKEDFGEYTKITESTKEKRRRNFLTATLIRLPIPLACRSSEYRRR